MDNYGTKLTVQRGTKQLQNNQTLNIKWLAWQTGVDDAARIEGMLLSKMLLSKINKQINAIIT